MKKEKFSKNPPQRYFLFAFLEITCKRRVLIGHRNPDSINPIELAQRANIKTLSLEKDLDRIEFISEEITETQIQAAKNGGYYHEIS